MASATRQQLLDAAVELLLEEGGEPFTTVLLAKRAGVVQSAFYNHFASIAECRTTALQEVERRVLAVVDAVFTALQGSSPLPDEDVEPILLDLFNRAMETPTVYRLLVRRCHEPDLGAVIENVLASLRTAVFEILRLGTSHNGEGDTARTLVAAHLLTGIFLSGLEQVANGTDPATAATTCAAFMTSGISTLSP